ncbi:Dihydrolipoyllysine-residue acetyltransferase component of pyruvate dehydrogenase complex, partial [Haemophilus influenzae]
ISTTGSSSCTYCTSISIK